MLFFIILIVSLAFQFFTPWWTAMAVPFVICFAMNKTGFHSFLAGFLALFIGWLTYSLYFHIGTDGLLTNRVASIFQLSKPILLILLTAFVGALAAGIAGCAGTFCRKMFVKKKQVLRSRYR